MKKLLSILFLLPLSYSCTIAQTANKYAELITEETSKNHLTILASKEYEGRGTAQKGGRKAAEYVANEFKSYGLKPIVNGNSYYQHLDLIKTVYQVSNFTVGNQSYVNGLDFYVQGDNNNQSFDASEIIFVGYGIQDAKYNELNGVDIKGKVVLVYNDGEPMDKNGNSLITGTTTKSDWSTSRFKRLQELHKLGPKLILSTGSNVEQIINRSKGRLTAGRFSIPDASAAARPVSQSIPVVNITEKVANQLLASKKTSTSAFVTAAAQKVQKPIVIKTSLKTEMGVVNEKHDDPNVIGYLEGTDLKDEVIVICGHYDHDGILPDGTFFPGADDNGSGTVAVIEIARAFAAAKKDGKGPRRSILFIGLAAEEKGLLGSKFYVENPIISLDKTVACLNIDMIGRIDDKHLNGDHNYVHVIGVNKLSTDLRPIVELANRGIDMKLDYDYDHPEEPMRLYYRSDHYNFAKNGIPSLFFFSGLHPHYHTVEDTVDKIDFNMMVKRERLIFNTAWEMGNRDNKPVVDLSLEEAKGTGR